MSEPVLVAQVDGVRTLTLNRPEAMNALTLEAMRALGDRLEEAAADSGTRVVVITGAGPAFSAGGDLALLQALPTMSPAEMKEIVYGTFQRVPRLIRAMDKPVLAAVNGAAVGAGCEIAIACDLRIASEKARFGEGWITIGCVPAMGGMFLLPRLVGLAKAAELVMTGALIDAAEAHRIGLVNKVVMPPDLAPAVADLARTLADGPARALAVAKAAVNRGLDSSLDAELEAAVDDQLRCFATRDFAEGVQALAERRPPRFRGA